MTPQIARVFRYLMIFWAVLAMALPASVAWAAPYAAIVTDARTGETLYESNADTRLHPASLTKMMTLYVAFEEIRAGRITLDTRVTISRHAAAQPPSRLGLKPGQKITLRHLIRASAVRSANDAATAIGEAISGSEPEFAKRMTRTARALGMSNTTFKNAHGLTAPGHLSSARDMNTLGLRLFYDFPEYYNIFSRRTADAGIATVRSTNTRFLDNYKGADGIKTGYTIAAGFNLTASAERGNTRIIATVFGGDSTAHRNARMAELLDLGFDRAPANARVRKPAAPDYGNEALIAMDAGPPENVPGSSAKTVRVSGEVRVSLLPMARPVAAQVPSAVAAALAEGIEGALAEAITPPPPAGTLEAQALELAHSVAANAIAPPPPAVPPVTPPPAGTLEAQALALAEQAAGSLQAQAIAQGAAAPGDPALVLAASPRPMSRPEGPNLASPPQAAVAQPGPAAPAGILPETPETTVAGFSPDHTGGVSAVETVASVGIFAPPVALPGAAAMAGTTRRAPIFDAVTKAEPAPEAQEVVVAISTSGGSQWGVSVGGFTSHGEAEKAMFRLALAESATLNVGLRKVVQQSDGFAANFLGLSEAQADLACRRLAARAVRCDTVGP